MKLTFFRFALAAVVAVCAIPATAQVPGDPMSEARSRVACGAGELISATYISGNLLRVTCRQQGDEQRQRPDRTPAEGTGLTTPAVAGVIVSLVLIAGLTGSDGTGTTTTTADTAPDAGER